MHVEFTIEDVERLVVKPGEVLLVTVRRDYLTAEDAETIRETVKAKLPEGVEVLVKTLDIDVAVVAKSDV